MKMNIIRISLVLFVSILPSLLVAQTAEERGLEIAKKVDLMDRGFGDAVASIAMTLRDQHGNERTRYMRNRIMEVDNDGDKSIIIFDNPGDVKGTAFLSYTHKEGSDDQWLYLPRLKRVKKISSSNKAGAFMNSEFAFEDIASQEVEKYSYKFLREDEYEGKKCFVIESDPVDVKSGYSRLEVWIDQQRYIPLKTDFYDRGGRHKKTLMLSEYQQHLDKFWRAEMWNMQNHQTGKSTLLTMKEWKFRNGFSEQDFNKNSLSRTK